MRSKEEIKDEIDRLNSEYNYIKYSSTYSKSKRSALLYKKSISINCLRWVLGDNLLTL